MFAFNRNNDKSRDEIILIGFKVRPKGRAGYNSPTIPEREIFTSTCVRMTQENLLVWVIGETGKWKKEQLI